MITIMSTPLLARLRRLPATRAEIAEGAYLFHAGDPVAALHLVEHGDARLLRHQEDGTALVLQRAGPGAILAEASLFAARYHCDAVAATPLVVRRIPRATLRAALVADADLAEAWAAHLSREVQAARLRAEILSLRGLAARLDAWLAWHGPALPPRGQWRTLAADLAVTPEALYRELARRRPG
jgi:CRP-like cAMP-binding protein